MKFQASKKFDRESAIAKIGDEFKKRSIPLSDDTGRVMILDEKTGRSVFQPKGQDDLAVAKIEHDERRGYDLLETKTLIENLPDRMIERLLKDIEGDIEDHVESAPDNPFLPRIDVKKEDAGSPENPFLPSIDD